MATVDSELVRRELKALINLSNAVKNQVRQMFEQLENDPSVFDALDETDPSIPDEFENVILRKVYIRHGRHDYRVIFAHWILPEEDHVDILLVFPRKKQGYSIDWQWVSDRLRDSGP